ncbi:MAG: aminodeoxychorismate/anthranilate synthase component II [Paludibacteraceae bacterium]|nr:aminodeoxychorismate/anthranilate synthase component II [Paludibacteraceae bacterium]
MKIVIIDNYDSFTYNLYHLLREVGADTSVVRNDKFALPDLEIYDKIVLSPGPGIPSEAGLLLDTIDRYAGKKPILGVCLGHQALGQYFGAELTNLTDVFHGVQTDVEQTGEEYLFNGLPKRFPVGRYHSWVVDAKTMPDTLEVTAKSDEGLVMALKHKAYDIHGIQFHPESVLTPDGRKIIENFINK